MVLKMPAMQELTEGYKDLILVLAVPGLYSLMVLAGRRLKQIGRAHV